MYATHVIHPYFAEFNAAPAFIFLHDHTWLPLLSVALYLVFCFYGPIYMHDRK